jgi:two-component system invasion response regulator UvrY
VINLLIVDDHAVVRRGLRQILQDEPGLSVQAEAADGYEALKAVRARSFDVVVLDVSMPGRNGLEVLEELRRERPTLPVLILSVHPEEQLALRLLKAGAAGYLSKDSAPEELVTAIRRVAKGGKYMSATLADRLVEHLQTPAAEPRHESLSDREFEVLLALAGGQRIKEIAARHNLSVKTVSTYRARVLRKLGVQSNAELTLYAARQGLITPPQALERDLA